MDLGSDKSLFFSVKVGKSYKNGGWAIKRDEAIMLLPKLSYEDECDIIVDGIHSKAKLNIVPRVFYNRTGPLSKHLEKLHAEGKERVDLQFLLNEESIFQDRDEELNNAYLEINHLTHIINDKDSEISRLNEEFNKLDNNSDIVEVKNLQDEVNHLKSLVQRYDKERDNLFDTIVQLENENNELLKKRLFYENENRKLINKMNKLREFIMD